jgi:hypothetical protein
VPSARTIPFLADGSTIFHSLRFSCSPTCQAVSPEYCLMEGEYIQICFFNSLFHPLTAVSTLFSIYRP